MKPLTGALVAMLAGMAARDVPVHAFPLQGTWTLVAADKILPDGKTVRDYGENPKGRLVVDDKGRYSLQIFKSERQRFASDSKADASVDEFRSAVMGSSTHYGTMTFDEQAGVLVFSIEGSSFPNWDDPEAPVHAGWRRAALQSAAAGGWEHPGVGVAPA